MHTLSYTLEPYPALLLVVVALAILQWRYGRAAKWLGRCCAGCAFLLLAISMPPVSYLCLGTLEWHHPPRTDVPTDVRAMVVLSGAIHPPNDVRPRTQLGSDTLYRCLYAAELYQQFQPHTIIVTGGKVDPQQPGPTLAKAMFDFLVAMGVPSERMVVEQQSRSTYENAVYSSRLLKQLGHQRAVLVTSACHLYRAERCFERQGIDVVPAGCDYRATELDGDLSSWIPSASAASGVGDTFHEWLGIAWYWLRGRI